MELKKFLDDQWSFLDSGETPMFTSIIWDIHIISTLFGEIQGDLFIICELIKKWLFYQPKPD